MLNQMDNNMTKFKLSLIVIVFSCSLFIVTSAEFKPDLKNHEINLESARQCCDNNQTMDIKTKQCFRRGNHTLTCEKYMLNPDNSTEDQYVIQDDQTLYMYHSNYDQVIAKDRYCVTELQDDDNLRNYPVAFICFDNDPNTSREMFIFKGILITISVIFIILTLYVYAIIPDLRETQDKIIICGLITFAIGLAILATVQFFNIPYAWLCITLAFIMHFCMIGYFAWLNMIMANVFKMTVLYKWRIAEKKWYLFTHLYGWGIPTFLLIITLIGQHSDLFTGPGFGEQRCWFKREVDEWKYMYLPMSIMLAINIVLFVWSGIFIRGSNLDISPDRKAILQFRFRLYVSLLLIAGITWIFEILSHNYNSKSEIQWWFIITDIINGLHGVTIFIILVLWRRRVRKALAGKRILCFTVPRTWGQTGNDDLETLQEEDDIVFEEYEKMQIKI